MDLTPCPACGYTNLPNASSCLYCGAPTNVSVDEIAVEATEAGPPGGTATIAPDTIQAANIKKKSGTWKLLQMMGGGIALYAAYDMVMMANRGRNGARADVELPGHITIIIVGILCVIIGRWVDRKSRRLLPVR